MYSNGMLAADTTEMRLAGYTPVMKWSHNNPARQGEDLFRAVCASCHSLTGYNGLATRIARHSWNGQQVADIIPRIGYMRGAMPPWVGSPVEAEALADYLSREAEQRPKPQQRDSRAIWSANCGLCHTIDGHRPLRDALSGMTPSDIKDLVKSVGELSDAMPPFSGNEADAERIVAYAIQYLEKNPAKGGRR